VSRGAVSQIPWAPLPDDQLSWFRADQSLFATPRPLDYTLEIHALIFGLTYALESIEFPLYGLRSRLVHGRVYLAAVPSAMAEGDLAQRLRNIHDQSLRFTRNIQHAWERQIKPELERYNLGFEEVAAFRGSSAELAGKMRKLRRDRGNQWFTAIRGVVLPAVLLRQNAGESGNDIGVLAENLTRLVLAMVAESGKALISCALARAGERLAQVGAIENGADVFWLEWGEVCDLLPSPVDHRGLVAQRKLESERDAAAVAAESLGPRLPPDAPKMYLIPEILRSLDIHS
jgi:hypothetical protein